MAVTTTIGLFDLNAPLQPLRDRIRDRLFEVMERGLYILGPEVEAFEASWPTISGSGTRSASTAAPTRSPLAYGPSGSSLTTRSWCRRYLLRLGRGDRQRRRAARVLRRRPRHADIVTADTVRAALTPRTTAIVAVDLFGIPAPMAELRELGLPVLEDAAQAAGSSIGGRRAGSLSELATFSFYPSKNLGALGDGGAIATNDDQIAELARALRFHGSHDKQNFDYVGYNSRLDEMQAAILRVLLPELDSWCDGRRAAARAYAEAGHRPVSRSSGRARER